MSDITGSTGLMRVAASAKLHVFSAVVAVLSVLIIGAVYLGGISRGMDAALTYAPQSEENGLAVAISELVYGLDRYVAHWSVVDKLAEIIHRGVASAHDEKILPNLRNADLINEAISAAINLGPRPPGHISNSGLRTMVYDDIGIVDFMKIAFTVFGFEIQSLYKLFFAILLVSTVAYLVQFWGRPAALAVLLCVLSTFYLELNSPIFIIDMPSFWGMRHGSTLVLLPMWHVALLLLLRIPLSIPALALGAVQVAIIVLAVKMRGSAMWAVLFIGAIACWRAWLAWRSEPREGRWKRLPWHVLSWPFAALLAGMAMNSVYTNAKLHPAYFTDDIMPYHGAWHSAFIGLNISKDFWPRTGVTADVAPHSDMMVYRAALSHLHATGFIASEREYLSPWTHTYKMRLHDRVVKGLFLQKILEAPGDTVALYVFYKPRHLWWVWGSVFDKIVGQAWLVVGGGAVLLGICLGLLNVAGTSRQLLSVLGFSVAALAFAVLPNIWAYAAIHTIADFFLSSLVIVLVGATLMVTLLVQWGMERGKRFI